MSTIIHEYDNFNIEVHGDNEVRIRGKHKKDPVKLRLALDRALIEQNIAAVSFDAVDGDVSDELGQVGCRVDDDGPSIYISLKLPGDDHVSEVVHVNPARAFFAVPLQAPNYPVVGDTTRLVSGRYIYQLQDDEPHLPYGTIIVYDTHQGMKPVAQLKPVKAFTA